MKNKLKESIVSTQQIFAYTEPVILEELKKCVANVDKKLEVVKIMYTVGSPNYVLIINLQVEENLAQDKIYGRTKILTDLHKITKEIGEQAQQIINVVSSNLLSYKFKKFNNINTVEFGVNLTGSFTAVVK